MINSAANSEIEFVEIKPDGVCNCSDCMFYNSLGVKNPEGYDVGHCDYYLCGVTEYLCCWWVKRFGGFDLDEQPWYKLREGFNSLKGIPLSIQHEILAKFLNKAGDL